MLCRLADNSKAITRILTSNHANGFTFLSHGCFKTNVIVIVITIAFNVIVIERIMILFIHNRNCACAK